MPLLSFSDTEDGAAEGKQASGTASACSTLITVQLLFSLTLFTGKADVLLRWLTYSISKTLFNSSKDPGSGFSPFFQSSLFLSFLRFFCCFRSFSNTAFFLSLDLRSDPFFVFHVWNFLLQTCCSVNVLSDKNYST